jgi:cobyrinic acid a,c-diamide synthase
MTGGLIISAPASGTGKTTVMLGLARAFVNAGRRVQCFKSGPDYIDPAFHAAASRRRSVNLDTWAMGPAQIADLIGQAGQNDLILAEGSMGLFDGVAIPGEAGNGSSADLSALTGWPVVVVLDCAGQAQTAAAVARGLMGFRAGVDVAGVILNRIASPRHEALVRHGMDEAGVRVFGALPRLKSLSLPERHLGLVQAQELPELETFIAEAAEVIASHVDLSGLAALARPLAEMARLAPQVPPPGQRIALAKDAAFSFTYPHLVDQWLAAGASILPFSPLADEAPDDSADACWLPGGYPELHAGLLASNDRFRAAMQRFAQTRPVHGECGGYMAMGAGLVDAKGQRHQMLGLLGLETSFEKRRMHLGYRLANLRADALGFAAGARLRGHEFHYATILAQPDLPLADVVDATGSSVAETGSRRDRASGTFFHLIAKAQA